jgi:hypothetical protein
MPPITLGLRLVFPVLALLVLKFMRRLGLGFPCATLRMLLRAHHVLELRPQGFYGGEFVADLVGLVDCVLVHLFRLAAEMFDGGMDGG